MTAKTASQATFGSVFRLATSMPAMAIPISRWEPAMSASRAPGSRPGAGHGQLADAHRGDQEHDRGEDVQDPGGNAHAEIPSAFSDIPPRRSSASRRPARGTAAAATGQ